MITVSYHIVLSGTGQEIREMFPLEESEDEILGGESGRQKASAD